ncbi:MAG: hypothetical protein H6705_16710 [Myxococcales bacterium]|nr:hypothetical protein [Myxococcales bacterium]
MSAPVDVGRDPEQAAIEAVLTNAAARLQERRRARRARRAEGARGARGRFVVNRDKLLDEVFRDDALPVEDKLVARRLKGRVFSAAADSVLARLSDKEQRIVAMLRAGCTHQAIANELGLGRVTVTGLIGSIASRIGFWLSMPTLPDAPALERHLVDHGATMLGARRLARFLGGASLRVIAAEEGVGHPVVSRTMARAVRVCVARAARCSTCRAVAEAAERRRTYRPAPAGEGSR